MHLGSDIAATGRGAAGSVLFRPGIRNTERYMQNTFKIRLKYIHNTLLLYTWVGSTQSVLSYMDLQPNEFCETEQHIFAAGWYWTHLADKLWSQPFLLRCVAHSS